MSSPPLPSPQHISTTNHPPRLLPPGVDGSQGAKVFWRVLDDASSDHKNLIAYYLSKGGLADE